MDRQRRGRGDSPSRDARAALLSRIAAKRAEKSDSSNLTLASQIAHSTPLPASDDSGSETGEDTSPFAFKTSTKSDDSLTNVLDSLGNLSLNRSNASSFAQRSNSTSRPYQKEPTPILEDFGRSNPNSLGNNSEQAVDLSSDDEDDDLVPFPRRTYDQGVTSSHSHTLTSTESESKSRTSKYSETRKSDSDQSVGTSGEGDEDWLKGLDDLDMVLTEGSKNYVLSGKIASKLYKHQQSGIRWLWGLHLKEMGGILGDDMGLGKTLLIASFFAGLFATKLIRTAMVVAPKTLISHWIKELTVVGLSRKTYSFVDTSSRVRLNSLHKVLQMGGILLTTYDMVRCNLNALQGEIHGRDGYGDKSDSITTWDYLVLDEGHLIKNPSTGRATSLRELPSTHRIIISGTPIQNNLKEMWALMDFCCPGLLGDKRDFKDKFERQIVAGNDKHASDRQKRLGAATAQELRVKMAPFFLRRMKAEVFPEKVGAEAQIARKNDFIVWLQLTSRQEQLYRAFLESEAVSTAISTSRALTTLSVLKKICDHPSLLTKRAAEDIAEGMEEMMGNDRVEAEAMTANLAGLAEDLGCGDNNDNEVSCKIAFLLILLEKLLDEGHRTLIFSQTRKMLNIIQAEMEERGWKYCRIDGTMKSSEREVAVADFQTDQYIPFFLLTSQVGGLGLTLTAANRVVIVDPAWNPSVDNQSVDRAYRIGQKKDVTVYRLMTCGTLEEKVYRKQVFKGGLMKVATESKNQLRYFSAQELHELFRVPDTGFSVSTTQKQLAEEHFGEHRTTKEIEEHIQYLEGLPMIAGVSHHDLLYSKAAPPLPPAEDGQDDTNVKWEPRNAAYNPNPSKPGSKVDETYTWDPANDGRANSKPSGEIYDEAKHAYLRVYFLKDKIKRMAATLENEAMVSKLSDNGAKIMAKIKEYTAEIEKLKVTAAPYEKKVSAGSTNSLSSSNPPPKPLASGSNNYNTPRFGTSSFDLGVNGRNHPEVVTLGDSPVKVRSASGNNIYSTPVTGTADARKLRGSDTGAENVEDFMTTLRL